VVFSVCCGRLYTVLLLGRTEGSDEPGSRADFISLRIMACPP
jgi:hypothetical protein